MKIVRDFPGIDIRIPGSDRILAFIDHEFFLKTYGIAAGNGRIEEWVIIETKIYMHILCSSQNKPSRTYRPIDLTICCAPCGDKFLKNTCLFV